MGCLVFLTALFLPRVILFLVWVFNSGYLSRAFSSGWVALLGFFFLPATTLMYAFAENRFNGMHGGGLILVILGVFIDLGLLGGGGGRARQRRRQDAR
jgi:hypothetical protein